MSYILGIDTSAVDATPKFTVGTVGANQTSAGYKKYKYVKWTDGSAAAAVIGEVSYYHAAGGAQDSLVTSDLTESVQIGAGVIQSLLTEGTFGWVQIAGPATLTIALSAGADGNALTPVGSADGTLDVSALVTDHICAIADDVTAKEIVCMFPE